MEGLQRKSMQQLAYFTFGIVAGKPPSLDSRTTIPRSEEVSAIIDLVNEPQTRTVLITGTSGAGKSTLAALVFAQFQSQMLAGLSGIRHCLWLRPGPRATWPDLIRAILNGLQVPEQQSVSLSQQVNVQVLYETLRRPGDAALIVLDQCEELFNHAIEAQNQAAPYAVGIGLSNAVRFLEMLQQDLGESRILLTCPKSPFGSDHQVPSVREYVVKGITNAESTHLLQQRGAMGQPQDLADLWQRCSGHIYSLLMFNTLQNLSGLSLHYLLSSPMYQILWEGNVTQNLAEAVVGFLNPVQLALARALCLFREAAPLAGVIEVATGESAGQVPGFQLFEQEMRNLVELDVIEQIERYDGKQGYSLHPVLARYLLSHYLENEQRKASSYLSASSLGVANQPAPLNVNQEARRIALAAGHMRVAAHYKRVAQQVCPPRQQRNGPNDAALWLAMLEHLCLGWHWQDAYDQLYALGLDEDLLRWEIWHTLINLYEMMLPPSGSLNRRDEGLVNSALGMIYGRLGESEQSRTYFTSALAIQRDMGDRQSEAITLTNQGEFLRAQGDTEQARRNFEQALSLLQTQANPELACVLSHNMALLMQQRGDYQQSQHYFMQALQLVRQGQDKEREAMILTNLGLLLCEQQRYQEGLALLFPALQVRSTRQDQATYALIAFLNKLEQRMGNETFASLRQEAQTAGKQEQVLRALTQ
jgi:Tfp pilus assembly protein PilF